MARKKPTQTYLKKRLRYFPKTGLFIWLPWADNGQKWNTRRAGKVAGGLHGKYMAINFGFGYTPYHKLAVLYMKGVYPKFGPDHKDLNTLNNKWRNLRPATVQENNCNRRMHRNNSIGHKNITLSPSGKFKVHVMKNRKQLYLGSHPTLDVALKVAAKARKKLFGEFARHK